MVNTQKSIEFLYIDDNKNLTKILYSSMFIYGYTI